VLGKWGDAEKVKLWARGLIAQPQDLLLLFKALMEVGQTEGGEQSWTNYTFDPKGLEIFLAPDDLKPIPFFETEDPLELRIVMVIKDWISGRAKPISNGHLFIANKDNITGALLDHPTPDVPFQ